MNNNDVAMFQFAEPALWGGVTWVVFFRRGFSRDGYLDAWETDTRDIVDEKCNLTFHLITETANAITFTLTRAIGTTGLLKLTYHITTTKSVSLFEHSGDIGSDEFEVIHDFMEAVYFYGLPDNLKYFMERKGQVGVVSNEQ